MSISKGALLVIATFAAFSVLSGYGIDRGYPSVLYALTASIIEDRSLSLDARKDILGYDKAIHEGRIYSDKAPGPSLLMIPAFLAARAMTENPDLRFTLTLLLGLTLPVATAPLGVAILLRRAGCDSPIAGASSFAVASLFLPYATVGISDPLAATAVAWAYAASLAPGGGSLAAAGACAGLAILTRYQAALLVAPLALGLLHSLRRRSLPFLVPLLLAAALALGYNAACFGHPLRFPTYYWRGKPGAAPTLQMDAPTLERAAAMAFGPRRGLFVYTPLLLLAPLGAVDLARRSRRIATTGIVALVLYFGYLTFNRGWAGGADYGMRFSVPALPLLWLLIYAPAGRLASRLRCVLLAPSLAVALLGALAGPYVPYTEPGPIMAKARELWRDGPRTMLDGVPRGPQ